MALGEEQLTICEHLSLIHAQTSADPALFVKGEPHSPLRATKPLTPNADESSEEDDGEDENEFHDLYDEDGVDEESKEKLEAVRRGLRKPYIGTNEDPPDLPAYHPTFAKVERICEELFAGAAELLKTSDYQDKYTQWLMKKIQRHQAIAYPAPKKISLVGDSGVGKCTVMSPTYTRTDY